MNKYKVEILQTDKFIVDVLAKNENDARDKAEEKWNKIADSGTYHYYQEGDTNIDYGIIYDVTGTDDPFNP
jgi:hypothetical protein